MKPFDLEAAKRGEPIVTRGGRKVTFVGHIPEACDPRYRVVVYIDGDRSATSYDETGSLLRVKHPDDLFMAPRKRTVYVNLWPMSKCYGNAIWYDSVDEARNSNTGAIATAVPVKIEV